MLEGSTVVELKKHLVKEATMAWVLAHLSLLPRQDECLEHVLDLNHNVDICCHFPLLKHLVRQILIYLLPPMIAEETLLQELL